MKFDWTQGALAEDLRLYQEFPLASFTTKILRISGKVSDQRKRLITRSWTRWRMRKQLCECGD
jgi:hypothetical protein